MASSPKKAHRPAVRQEPPAPPASDTSVSALQAAEALPPVGEPAESPPAELLEAPAAELTEALVAEVEADAPPAVQVAPPVAALAEPAPPQVAEAPSPAAPASDALAVKALGGNVRELIEKSIVESRARFGQVKVAAAEASAAVDASYGAVRDGVVAFNVKAIEALKARADANFEFALSLASAKSFAEALKLQGEFARKQFEDASSQAKGLAELARKVADDSVAPIKAHVAKTFKIAV